jgi:hypothetical protein
MCYDGEYELRDGSDGGEVMALPVLEELRKIMKTSDRVVDIDRGLNRIPALYEAEVPIPKCATESQCSLFSYGYTLIHKKRLILKHKMIKWTFQLNTNLTYAK